MMTRDCVSTDRLMKKASGLFAPERRDRLTSRALGALGLARQGDTISRSAATGLMCGALAMGAALAYLFDPTTGRRRRHVAGQRLYRSARKVGEASDVAARDIANRTRGFWASLRALYTDDDAPDYVIEDRVRARLGHVASHPRAINVESDMGVVMLSGPVLADEVDDVLRAVWKTRGVRAVVNDLEPHPLPDIPALQGGGRRRADVARERWSPATRLIAGVTGIGCMSYCLSKRTLPAALIGTAGFALFVRAASNRSARELAGIGDAADAVHVQKIINIDAPPEIVFDFWANYDNFPLFMKHVKEVCDCGDGTSHWTVDGPAGTTVEWDAYLTDWEPNRLIAWRSFPDSTVANEGKVRFQENPDGSTRVDVHLCYTPPGGAIGEAVARLFGADAKSEMDDDLLRMKTLIETGRFPHDAAQHVGEAGAI
ncbi:MAG: putative integral rane protein [Phycisphaerales bacterium]|nr:putative integral rane protein [Phycisphaerales bacterium]